MARWWSGWTRSPGPAGSSTLELYYRRPWEEAVPPQKVFRVMVEVR